MKEIDMSKQKFNGIIKLFYINSSGSLLFGEELKAMDHKKTITEFFKDKKMLESRIKQMVSQNNYTVYFVAGTKQMTNSIKEMLIELGVKKKNIKTDTFIGY